MHLHHKSFETCRSCDTARFGVLFHHIATTRRSDVFRFLSHYDQTNMLAYDVPVATHIRNGTNDLVYLNISSILDVKESIRALKWRYNAFDSNNDMKMFNLTSTGFQI